jgi:hypothetical protein
MPASPNTSGRDRPCLIFDGDSQICQATIDRWREPTGEQVKFVAYREVGELCSKIDDRKLRSAVHFVDVDSTMSSGAGAFFRAAAHCGRKRWLFWLYKRLPPFALAADGTYRFVAASRRPASFILRIWRGKDLRPPTYHISTALFLRLLGLVYFIAFVSLWTQVGGLVGDHGILPAKEFLDAANHYFAQQTPPASAAWNLPTLAWFNPHDGFLDLLCGAGTLLSVMLTLGLLPVPTVILLWVDYLSLFHAGQVFLGFQWDILLLETGCVAIFLAPAGLRSKFLADRHPPRLAVWLVWWLLFRLMFESGAVKLTWNQHVLGPGGSPIPNTWSSLTALDFHYWTQPLPIWTSWYTAKLPEWFQKVSVLFVFLVELILPWLIFGPRLLRSVAFGGITLLMLLIAATGNYNFFNLLTVLLALMLLDDKLWPRFLRSRIRGTDCPVLASPTRWRTIVLVPFACLAIVLGGLQVQQAVAPRAEPAPPLESKMQIGQFFFVNGYGLFRQMTETRPEILIEGSDNGTEWRPYEFHWKPGSLGRAPGFNTPHQPRLDWQMWFEALRLEQVQAATGAIDPRYASPWFQMLLMKLLKGEPQVTGLLASNPFPSNPPKFIRIALYQYRFTSQAEWQAKKEWWHREEVWTGPGWSLGP